MCAACTPHLHTQPWRRGILLLPPSDCHCSLSCVYVCGREIDSRCLCVFRPCAAEQVVLLEVETYCTRSASPRCYSIFDVACHSSFRYYCWFCWVCHLKLTLRSISALISNKNKLQDCAVLWAWRWSQSDKVLRLAFSPQNLAGCICLCFPSSVEAYLFFLHTFDVALWVVSPSCNPELICIDVCCHTKAVLWK